MRIIGGTEQFEIEQKTAVALGKFDGIHIGHQKLLNRILAKKQEGLLAVVFTFDPAPAAFFRKENLPQLTTKEEKRRIFEQMGIDILIEFPMNERTAATLPGVFIREYLVSQMKMAFVAAGEDVSFGKQGKGDCALLKSLSAAYQYEVEVIEKVCYEGKEVSSTYLRSLVETGNMEVVSKLLQENYSFCGEVIYGKQLGRTIGMPTVNVKPNPEKLLPAFGVYYSRVLVKGKWYPAITNIGYKPTVDDTHTPVVESYLYDFAKEVYGEEIEVRLLSYKRPEMKFASVEALCAQMQEDIQCGRVYHAIDKA